jgi:hypothetical protein
MAAALLRRPGLTAALIPELKTLLARGEAQDVGTAVMLTAHLEPKEASGLLADLVAAARRLERPLSNSFCRALANAMRFGGDSAVGEAMALLNQKLLARSGDLQPVFRLLMHVPLSHLQKARPGLVPYWHHHVAQPALKRMNAPSSEEARALLEKMSPRDKDRGRLEQYIRSLE